jgi:Flp pilus assembly protein TadD
LHRPDDAETALLEAVKENPSNRVNAYFAGQQLLLDGKFEAALPYLYSALQWKTLQSRALNALALTQARLGNYGLAESYCRKAIDSPESSLEDRYSALLNLSTLLLLGHDPEKLADAMHCAEAAQKLQPASPQAQYLAGKALFKLGRLNEAKLALISAAKLNPQDRKVHFLLAKVYAQLGQPDRARDERKAFVQIQGPARTGMATADPVSASLEDLPDNLHR